MRTELRGIWMAGKLAEEQINNTGWGFYLNSNNLVLHEAKTRMNSAFAGGGGYLTSSPTRLLGTRSVHLHSDFC